MLTGACEECAGQSAAVRYGAPGCERMLCLDCFRQAYHSGQSLTAPDLPRFHVLLARPKPARGLFRLPAMPPDTVCPGCGVTLREAADRGLLGCEECYTTFAPALAPVLGPALCRPDA